MFRANNVNLYSVFHNFSFNSENMTLKASTLIKKRIPKIKEQVTDERTVESAFKY